MIDENVDKRKRERTRDPKLLGCSITVAQIKITVTRVQLCKWQSGGSSRECGMRREDGEVKQASIHQQDHIYNEKNIQ